MAQEGMPAGSRQWIVGYNSVGDGVSPAQGQASLPYPSPNYETDATLLAQGFLVYYNADSTANRMRVSCFEFKLTGIFFYNSMMDTYTITGPPGTEGSPVTAHVRFHATGTLFVSPTVFGGHMVEERRGSIVTIAPVAVTPYSLLSDGRTSMPMTEAPPASGTEPVTAILSVSIQAMVMPSCKAAIMAA